MNKLYLFVLFCCMSVGASAVGYYPSAVSIPSGATTTYCTGMPNALYTATVTMCGATTTATNKIKAKWYFNNLVIDSTTVIPTSSAAITFTLNAGTITFNTAGTFTGTSGLRLVITDSLTPPGSCAASPLLSAALPIVVNATPTISGPTSVCVGSSMALAATPTGGTWSASGSATVSSTGLVTGTSVGLATITYNSGSCVNTLAISVAGTAGFASGSLSVCANVLTDTLRAVPAGGTWTSSNTSVATIGASSGIVTPVAAGATTMSYTAGACATGVILNVIALPSAITGPSSYCPGGITTLSSATSGGTWSSSNSTVASISTIGVLTAAGVGTATISYTSPSTGCSATAVVTVSTTPAPITGPTAVCVGGTIPMLDATFGGTWASSVAAVGTVNASTGIVTGVAPGTTTINYIVPGCAFASAVVTVTPVPSAIFGGGAPICPSATMVLTNSVSGGMWSSAPTTVAVVSPTGVVTGVSGGTATITYSIGTGCTVTTVVTVSAGPAPITGPSSVCIGSTITLANTVSGGVWSNGGSSQATVSPTGVVTGANAGIVAISYTSTGCTVTKIISVNANPVAITPTTGAAVCVGFSTSLSNAMPGGSWTASGGVTVLASGVVTGVAPASGIVTYTLPSGCFVTKVVSVNPLPTGISGSLAVCQGNTSPLTGAPASGTWTSTMTSIASIGLTSGIVAGFNGGTSTITYTLSTGCYITRVVTVGIPPAAITGPNQVCSGDTMTLHNAVSGGIWSSTPAPTASIGSSTGLVTGGTPGVASIAYTTPGCVPATKSVTVLALPAALTGPSSVCVGTTVTLTSSTAGGTWSSSDTLRAKVDTGKVRGLSMGTVIISYKLTATGCAATKVMTVNPLAPIAGDDTVCAGSVTYLTNIVGGGSWVSSNILIGSIEPISGALTGLAPGITFIQYGLPTGCTASILVTVLPQQPPITGLSNVCSGSTTTLTNISIGGTWSSANNYVASIGSLNGVLVAGIPDTVTITYMKPHQCISKTLVTVNALPIPVITFSAAPPPATLSTASYYSSYQWFKNGTVIAGATGPTLALSTIVANYSVVVTDTNGCKGTAEWKSPASVLNYNDDVVSVYPNPTTGIVHIYAPVGVNAVISGIDGRTILQQANVKDLDITILANGIYMLSVFDEQGQKMLTQKLIKE
jgi:hypothetical protein